MPYTKKTYDCGDVIEVEKVFSGRYGKRIPHAEKKKPTPEDVKKVNERKAQAKLRRKLNYNFKFGDLHATLTYRKDERPTQQEAAGLLNKLLNKLRKEYKKAGAELKYIKVTEYKNKAIHHHLIINDKGDTGKLIRKFWQQGNAYFSLFDDTGQYEKLAAYLIKETNKTFKEKNNPNRLRWSCSRNLVDPEPKVEIIQASRWIDVPRPPKGYYVESWRSGISEVTGYKYQYYTLRRIKEIQKE